MKLLIHTCNTFISVFYSVSQLTSDIFINHNQRSTVEARSEVSEVRNHLVQVLVDLGELGRELLVLKGVALLVEDLCHGGDQQQPLLGVRLGEADGLARGQLQGGASGLLASQVPERFFWEFPFGLNHSHGRDEEESLEGGVGLGVEILSVPKQP